MNETNPDLDFELRKQMGFGRARAINDRINGGGKTTNDDFRCDAEQVEIGKDGRVVKSHSSRITNPSK